MGTKLELVYVNVIQYEWDRRSSVREWKGLAAEMLSDLHQKPRVSSLFLYCFM